MCRRAALTVAARRSLQLLLPHCRLIIVPPTHPAPQSNQAAAQPSTATATTPAPATPEGAAAVQEYKALRAEHLELKAKLQRSRKDNDRLLHEVKAYRKTLEDAKSDLQAARQRLGDVDRVQTRLANSEKASQGGMLLWEGGRALILSNACSHMPSLTLCMSSFVTHDRIWPQR
jgi:hypothetical protein